MAGSAVICVNCGSFFAGLADLQDQGGEVRMVGLAMKAKCPKCKRWFAVGEKWRPKQRRIRVEK